MKPEPLPLRRANGTRVHPATRWHRALGVFSTLIVIITVITGLALNHGDALDLPRRHPHNALVDKLYRQSDNALPMGYATARGFVTQLGAAVYLDGQTLASHDAALVGALAQGDTLLVAYRDGLVQYDAQGQVVENYAALDGLPPPLTRVGHDVRALVLETANGPLYFDIDKGVASTVPKEAMIEWAEASAPSAALAATLADVYRGSGVSYERVLLDLHSGRLFGRVGELVVDAAALCLLTLALTGTYMFFKFKRGAQRPPR
ncbi:MAG: PepSY domain-containing protein [Gammaproteobacteria bacterium]|nr:PepSY domain-containing protein [Gammaproteobacteria bacterium]